MAKPQYGHAHRTTKAEWLAILQRHGTLPCAELRHHPTCPRHLSPGMALDLAHDRRTGEYRGLAWPPCNRAEGARFGNRLRGLLTPRPQLPRSGSI